MKKEDVIKNQKYGIKWFKHVESFIGIEKIIEETINIHKKLPNVWCSPKNPNKWLNIHWAFMNSFRNFYEDKNYNIPKIRNNGQASFNLDEVLTNDQINYIKQELNIIEPYIDCWERS